MEYATQDADPKVFEPLRKPTMDAADAFRKRLIDTEPQHLEAVLEFAGRAYRRPLTQAEQDELTGLYRKLREQELPHDEAIRLTLARVLVAPAFLYKLEKPGPAAAAVAVTDWELATRLSYFLWSSAPDEELRALAAAGKLRDPDVLAAQMRRMLKDDRVRRLADEFGCQWLHVRGFDELNEKNEQLFPTFAGLRAAMYEESILFFTDLFRADRPVSQHPRRGRHLPERAAGEALRHPRRDRRAVAARRGRAEVRPRRHPRPGDDAGEAVRGVADQPDPARQLGVRDAARREAAAAAEGRAAAARTTRRRPTG